MIPGAQNILLKWSGCVVGVCSECDAATPPTGTVAVIGSGFSILSNYAFCVYHQPMRKSIPH